MKKDLLYTRTAPAALFAPRQTVCLPHRLQRRLGDYTRLAPLLLLLIVPHRPRFTYRSLLLRPRMGNPHLR